MFPTTLGFVIAAPILLPVAALSLVVVGLGALERRARVLSWLGGLAFAICLYLWWDAKPATAAHAFTPHQRAVIAEKFPRAAGDDFNWVQVSPEKLQEWLKENSHLLDSEPEEEWTDASTEKWFEENYKPGTAKRAWFEAEEEIGTHDLLLQLALDDLVTDCDDPTTICADIEAQLAKILPKFSQKGACKVINIIWQHCCPEVGDKLRKQYGCE